MKLCPRCGVEKPADQYNWRNKSKGWRHPECRECQRAAYRAARAHDPAAYNEAAKKRKQKWRANGGGKRSYAKHREQELRRYLRRKTDPAFVEKYRQRNRASYLANPAKQREATQRWLAKNPGYVAAYAMAYYEANKAKHFENARKRRARLRAATIQEFSLRDLDARMSVFGHRCAYCGGPFEHVDHVKPLSKGGPHCLANLRPACASCNLHKLAKHPRDWLGSLRSSP